MAGGGAPGRRRGALGTLGASELWGRWSPLDSNTSGGFAIDPSWTDAQNAI